MKGKLIVIEGTDSSGKETQAKMLLDALKKENISVCSFSFPRYDTPTGKIIGGPILGKEYIGTSYFGENVPELDPHVASLYYAADRLYNIDEINQALNSGINVILDRYIDSNLAHQGSKISDYEKRHEMYNFIYTLEYDLLKLPKPDATIFLHMPYDIALKLKSARTEKPDLVEQSEKYLKNAEKTYLELAEEQNYISIECYKKKEALPKEKIHNMILDKVKEILK